MCRSAVCLNPRFSVATLFNKRVAEISFKPLFLVADLIAQS